MSYVKTVWETGDVITAEKLNNMESGIEASSSHVITIDLSNETWTNEGPISSIDLGINDLNENVFAGKIYSVILPDLDTFTGLKLLSVYDSGVMGATFVPNYLPEGAVDFGYTDGAWYFDFTK